MKRLLSLLLVALTLWSLAFPALAMNLEISKHPSTARMMVRPKLGEGVDLNLYRYCGNNPVSRIDPSGLRDTTGQPCYPACQGTGWVISGVGVIGAIGLAVDTAPYILANIIRAGGQSALSVSGETGVVALSEAMVPATVGETAYIIGHGGTLASNMLKVLLHLKMLRKTRKITNVTLLFCQGAKFDQAAIARLQENGYTVTASNTNLAVVFGVVLFAEFVLIP